MTTDTNERAWRQALHEYRRALRRRRDLSFAVKLIIDEVLDHFGVNDSANPSLRRLKDATGARSFSTVQAAVKTAADKAILVVERNSSRFVFRLPTETVSALKNRALEIVRGCSEKQSADDKRALRSARPSAPKNDAERSEIRSRTCNNPTTEPTKKAREADPWTVVQAAMSGDTLRTDAFRVAWLSWVKYRTECRKALTPSTIKAQICKLESFGHDRAIRSIEASIGQGWRGLFDPDDRTGARDDGRRLPAAVGREADRAGGTRRRLPQLEEQIQPRDYVPVG